MNEGQDETERDDPFADLAPVPDEVKPDRDTVDRVGDHIPSDGSAEMVEALIKSALLPLNDFGNGQRFVLHFGPDVMFVPRVGWFSWDGTCWIKDDDMLVVRRRAQKLADLILREIPHLDLHALEKSQLAEKQDLLDRRKELELVKKPDRSDDQSTELGEIRNGLDAIAQIETRLRDRRSRHRRFATTTGNSARIDNSLKEAGVELAVAYEDLDAAPLDVNTLSGVLRFSVDDMSDDGAGKIARIDRLKPARGQYLTKIMPVKYQEKASRKLFDEFLTRVQPDKEMRDFIQRWFGLGMTGLPLQRLVFFYGGGANGKSVLVDIIARIFGNYAATARIESLTGTGRRGGGDATPDLIPLMGARAVRTSEPDEGQRLQEGLIKELTGGEPIQVRALHSDFVEVRPIFKLTMSGNHKPEIRGTDDGIWRRVMLVPFDVQIPEDERDPDLVNKLWEERDGIFSWLVDGLCDFLEGGLRPPDAVNEATRVYREESDPIGLFLTTCCVVTGDPADTIPSKMLGDAFSYHLIETGMSRWKPTTFARRIAAKAGQWRHPGTGMQFSKGKNSIAQYVGLRLTDTFQRRFDDAPKDHNGCPIGVASTPAPDFSDQTGV